NDAEHLLRGGEIFDHERRRGVDDARRLHEPVARRLRSPEPLLDIPAQARHLSRQLVGAGRRFAQPERERPRLPAGAGHAPLRSCPDSSLRIRYEACPSWKMSPGALSIAKSSFSVPTNVSVGSSTTR